MANNPKPLWLQFTDIVHADGEWKIYAKQVTSHPTVDTYSGAYEIIVDGPIDGDITIAEAYGFEIVTQELQDPTASVITNVNFSILGQTDQANSDWVILTARAKTIKKINLGGLSS